MADVVFEEYSIEVKNAIDSKIEAVLEECAGELESQVKRNSRYASGKTKNSFRHGITRNFASGEFIAHIGSNDENAIWEEFGTGEYALKGGRKGGWYIPAEKLSAKAKRKMRKTKIKGKIYYFTRGKTPSRAFWKAFTQKKSKIINRIQNSLKGL